jgi:hypothetical protein
VGDEGEDRFGAVLLEHSGSLDEGTARVGHVVHEDGDLVHHVTDENLDRVCQ